jgi:hypothetical protein
MAVIGINYTGGNHYDDNDVLIENVPKYESVYLHTRKGEFILNSGNFVKDWFDAKKKYIEEFSEKERLSGSSTCDHFIMDGAKFDSAYLHVDGETPILKYVDRDDPKWYITQEDIFNGWEMFVPEGTQPTWEELKDMCK